MIRMKLNMCILFATINYHKNIKLFNHMAKIYMSNDE